MGLLDDAIREHLELKRRSGAEPGEIARVEREALEPPDAEVEDVFDAQSDPATVDDEHSDLAYLAEQDDPDGVVDQAPALDFTPAAPDTHYEVESSVGQETVELDMQAVLDEDAEMTGAGDSVGSGHVAGHVGDAAALYSHQEAPLEWGSEPVSEGGTEPAEPSGHAEPADDQHQERFPVE